MKHHSLRLGWLIFLMSAILAITAPGANSAVWALDEASGRLEVLFFYSETCDKCRAIEDEVIPKLKEEYGANLVVRMYEISSLENFSRLLALEKSLGRPVDKTPPVAFVGREVFEGESSIRAGLEIAIARSLRAGVKPATAGASQLSGIDELIRASFQGLTLVAVITGGLLDGINPCAFATLIFLISYLTYLGKCRQEVLMTGAWFTVGVFVAYFAIGLGLLEILKQMADLGRLRHTVNLLLSIILAVLGGISLADYFRIRAGNAARIQLQLPLRLKQWIHRIIRERSVAGVRCSGFVMGFFVACLEFPCTGQIYFPIVAMLRTGAPKTGALIYLFVYNLMFILPLILVFLLVYCGVTSQRLSRAMQQSLGKVKLLTTFFLWGLALLLWVK